MKLILGNCCGIGLFTALLSPFSLQDSIQFIFRLSARFVITIVATSLWGGKNFSPEFCQGLFNPAGWLPGPYRFRDVRRLVQTRRFIVVQRVLILYL